MTQSRLAIPGFSNIDPNAGSLLARAKAWAVAPSEDWASTLTRVALGGVLFPHGGQHLFGWFGGFGFTGTYGWMTGTLGIPGPAAAFSIVFEMVVPFLLVAGVAGRLVGAMTAFFMLVAGQSHLQNGFFMNWLGTAPGEGFEYHILAATLALTLALRGSGRLSLDGRWAAKKSA
jgi:putative oxidoreductase